MPPFSALISYSHEASQNFKYLQCKFLLHNQMKNIPCVKIQSNCEHMLFFSRVLIVLIILISTSDVEGGKIIQKFSKWTSSTVNYTKSNQSARHCRSMTLIILALKFRAEIKILRSKKHISQRKPIEWRCTTLPAIKWQCRQQYSISAISHRKLNESICCKKYAVAS